MADALKNLLPRDKYQEPPEVRIIKRFIHDNYQREATVTVQTSQIIISVRGAALAGTIRMRLFELQELCQTDKRLTLRII